MAMPLLWAGTGGRKLGARVLQWTKRLTCPRGKNKLFKGEPEICYWAQVLQDWEARTKGTGNGQEPGGDGGGEGSGRRVQWNVPDRLWQGVFSAGGPWPCSLEAGLSVCSYGVGRVCMGAQSLSHVWLFVTPGTVAAKLLHTCFFPPQGRILEWIAISSSRGPSWPRNWTCVSCGSGIGRQALYHGATWKPWWGGIERP